MGILSQMLQAGGIEIETTNPTLPKGVQLTFDYYKREYDDVTCLEDSPSFPRCDLEDLYSKEDLDRLKSTVCPNAAELEWRNGELVPLYNIKTIDLIVSEDQCFKRYTFPEEYAIYRDINVIILNDVEDFCSDRAIQESYQTYLSILQQIDNAIKLLNKDNYMLKEREIWRMMRLHYYKIGLDINDITQITMDKYLEIRPKLIEFAPELNY